jgi:hypothetical protein
MELDHKQQKLSFLSGLPKIDSEIDRFCWEVPMPDR